MAFLEIVTASPMMTIQDAGRSGALRYGLSMSGPMDRSAFCRAGALLEVAGSTCLEFGTGKFQFVLRSGHLRAAFAGGAFTLHINGIRLEWETAVEIAVGDRVEIAPGNWGNFGYIRFSDEIDVPVLVGSRSTNLVAGLGGKEGRTLRNGDRLTFIPASGQRVTDRETGSAKHGAIRFIWGLHADQFPHKLRENFLTEAFEISPQFDRMGMRLKDSAGVFSGRVPLSLVSDVVVAGDVQILGDGTPVVLMRDHQPTGGYPRIATVIGSDLDRLVQMRPGTEVRFKSISVDAAQTKLKSKAGK